MGGSMTPTFGSLLGGMAVASDSEKTNLVGQIKCLQRTNPDAKEQWYCFCQLHATSKYDPDRHEEDFLRSFLDNYHSGKLAEVGGADGKASLALKVKAFQRSGQENKERWYAYCQSHSPSQRGAPVFDPSRHDEAFLRDFLSTVDVSSLSLSSTGSSSRMGGKVSGKGTKPPAIVPLGVSDKIYVGSLPKDVEEQEIRDYFEQFGTITAINIKRDTDGSCRGFCFVTFAGVEASGAVLANYSGNALRGKWVDCKAAQPLPERSDIKRDADSAGGAVGSACLGAKCGNKGLKGGFWDDPWAGCWGDWWGGDKGGKGGCWGEEWGDPWDWLWQARMMRMGMGMGKGWGMGMDDSRGKGKRTGGFGFQPPRTPREQVNKGKELDPFEIAFQQEQEKLDMAQLKNNWVETKALSAKLFVGGLSNDTTEESVEGYFRRFGPVKEVSMKHASDGTFRGFCFVVFESAESVQAALDNYDHNEVDGRWVDCRNTDRPEPLPRPEPAPEPRAKPPKMLPPPRMEPPQQMLGVGPQPEEEAVHRSAGSSRYGPLLGPFGGRAGGVAGAGARAAPY